MTITMVMMVPFLLVSVLLAATLHPVDGAKPLPNILHILLDDFGWADAGWHRPANYTDLQSPNMVKLVKEGVEFDRHYVFQYCSPTRSAMQSGRNPIHVNTVNGAPQLHNQADAVSGYAGIPRNMTGIAEHMQRAGYETHMYGKWDCGMATPDHTPHGRGYEHSLSYYHHVNDAWNSVPYGGLKCPGNSTDAKGKPIKIQIVDLWDHTGPATGINNPLSKNCTQENQTGCVYEDHLFTDRVMNAIKGNQHKEDEPPHSTDNTLSDGTSESSEGISAADVADGADGADGVDVTAVAAPAPKPFFIFWAPRIVHSPLQVPHKELNYFSFINNTARAYYHAMVYYIDEAIGNVTQELKSSGQWDNTLMVVHADNGGPIYYSGCCGGNNYPLKGGKMSNWEGGIRVNAFASGGLLPTAVRGTKQTGLMAGWDWYATYCSLAGVDPTDHKAKAAGLPPIDSHDLWPLLSGKVAASPRTELAIGDVDQVGGLINKDGYKLLLGDLTQSGWTGPVFPNTSNTWNPSSSKELCGNTSATGCLFHVESDPGEHTNLAATKPDLWQQMMQRLVQINATQFQPNRGAIDPAACVAAVKYGGYWGPFIDTWASNNED